MRLLHVDSSARFDRSSSRELTAHFVAALGARIPSLTVDHLDVAAAPLPHVSEAFTAATYTPEAERTPAMREVLRISDALVDRLLAADAMVFGVPMYNFSMPSSFKAFVDHIVRGGRTYIWGPDRTVVGQLGGRRALFVTARGADLGPGSGRESADTLTTGLRTAFGFIGLTDVEFVDAQPLQFAGEARKQQALTWARGELNRVAERWANAGPASSSVNPDTPTAAPAAVFLRPAETIPEIEACWSLMRMLRPHLASAPMFADRIERQRADGYRLLVAWRSTKAVALAGWRVQENLLRGRHLYVDDLVTCPEDRGRGLGARLLAALAEEGRTLGCTALVLDTAVANTDAQRFYARESLHHTGLHFSKSLA